jgi:N-acyl-L-homoserine lactone synthetase
MRYDVTLPQKDYIAHYFSIASDSNKFIAFAKLRNQIFIEQEQWQLELDDGLETDQFDHFWAHYCLLFYKGCPVGGFRAIRTDKPYLLKGIFPHLAPGIGYPKSTLAWEISRFGVYKQSPNLTGMIMYALMFDFANRACAHQLIALTDLKHERLLKRMRIETSRYSEPSIVGTDRHNQPLKAVAGRIPIQSQIDFLRSTFAPLAEKVEINDQRDVFGLNIVSA